MNTLIEKYIDGVCGQGKVFKDDMRDYFKKSIFDVIELDDGCLYAIHKSGMETRFCFRYDEVMDSECGTNTYKDANDMARDVGFEYFLKENLKEMKDRIEHLREDKPVYWSKAYWRGTSDIVNCTWIKDSDVVREMTDAEKEVVIKVLEKQIENKTKRCMTYWKKYGKSKLHTWTYSCWD